MKIKEDLVGLPVHSKYFNMGNREQDLTYQVKPFDRLRDPLFYTARIGYCT